MRYSLSSNLFGHKPEGTIMLTFVYAASLATVVCIYVIYRWWTDVLRKMPGPPSLPFIGKLIELKRCQPHLLFTEWSKTYGDIFRVNVMGEYFVVVNDADLIRDVLIHKGLEFAGRSNSYRNKETFYDLKGITFQSYSPRFQQIKKMGHWALRSFGEGMERLETTMLGEINELVETIKEFKGQPFDPHYQLHLTVCNIMTSLVLGRRFSSKDPEIMQVKNMVEVISEAIHPVNGSELDGFPLLRFIGGRYSRLLREGKRLRDEFIDKHFDLAKKTLNPIEARGILDALLIQQLDLKGETKPIRPSGILKDTEIKAVTFDLTAAGTVTTSTALTMCVLVLINYPEIQNRLSAEIAKVVPRDRQPTLEDRPHLPYVDAFCYEVLRYMTHVPLPVPHVTMADTKLGGYDIPKGTQVLTNLWAVHHDKNNFEDPWCFKPDRFLDGEGKLVTSDHPTRRNLMLFGAGRRVCIGENLAKSRMFLVVSAIAQNFELLPEDPGCIPSADPRRLLLGLVLLPQKFKIRAIDRE